MDFKSYTLLIGLFSVAAAAPEVSDERTIWDDIWEAIRPNERIINGKSIDIKEVPWQVALLNNSNRHCGGSILSDRYILTAAHCLKGVFPPNLTVRAGSRYLERGGQLLQVKDFKRHGLFSEYYVISHDVAVIQLAEPLKFGPAVRPINLARQNPKNGESALVTGWGTQANWFLWHPDDLQGLNVKILDRKTCIANSRYQPFKIYKDVFCSRSPRRDACGIDAGGPLVSNDLQVGIVSWGSGCAHPHYPRVYASVAYFYDWIQDTIKILENAH